ncbi:MAG: hypothetical protein E7451_04400 [Ruminococcaceae bacterium]|nr:hypothetical protein [Oscillospiraceae bacterium]
MRTPVNLIVYGPETEEGREELCRRVALVHADAVNHRLKALQCPQQRKLTLLEAVIDTVRRADP